MIVDVYIKGEKLDLFDDESINITQGIQDVKDISKIFADFSQSFNVPASKTNNRIFKNYYNADIDNGFDARTRKDAVININTLPYKIGKIQLNGVKIKHNEPSSYQITFFGNAIKVKDLLGDDKLDSLDWLNNFDHSYNSTIVKDGLTNGLDFTVDGVNYPKAVIYPLISYQRQYAYDSNPTPQPYPYTVTNIAYRNGASDGIRFSELKPAIKLSLLIEAINKKYGFKFSGGFFESQEFKDIYVNLNKTTESLANGYYLVEDADVAINTSGLDRSIRYFCRITPKLGYENVEYKIRLKINDEYVYDTGAWLTGTELKSGGIINPKTQVHVTCEVITMEDFEFDARTNLRHRQPPFPDFFVAPYPIDYTDLSISLDTRILSELKDIKVYDFLTGLFKTFNLIVEPIGNDIRVEDLQTWYSEGRIIDVTPYIDTTNKQVDKGVIYNKMEFKFNETEQILADEFEQSNNRAFGNESLTLYTDDTQTEMLDGETLEIESIFENPIFERINNQFTGEQTNIMYCPYFNREIKSISGNPFMFYANSVSVSSNPIGFVGEANAYSKINGNILMPTHSQVIDEESFTLSFSSEVNEYTYEASADTIYSRYYGDYIGDIFSTKRRNYKLEAIFPTSVLQKLRLNDRLVIGNTRYIINKLSSNLTKRKDKLELINDIYDAPLASDELNTSLFRPTSRTSNGNATTQSTQYIGKQNQTPVLIDLGDGTSWITINSFGSGAVSTVTYTLQSNDTLATRYAQIQVNDGINNPKFTIIQNAKTLTVDNNIITVDNDNITADNG